MDSPAPFLNFGRDLCANLETADFARMAGG